MEVSLDRLERVLQGLRSPASLLAFMAWWVVLAFLAPGLPPLLLMLVAAMLGTVTGSVLEAVLRLRATPKRLKAVGARVWFMWQESYQLPPRTGQPLRVGLHGLACEIYADAITADRAEQRADELMEKLTKAQARFLRAVEEGKVTTPVLDAIRDQVRETLDPRPVWPTKKAIGRQG